MSLPDNPFLRGYRRLEARRVLEVSRNENDCLIRLPVHPSQNGLADPEIRRKPCVLCNGYAIIGTPATLAEEPTALCHAHGYELGFVEGMRYTILADENGRDISLIDVYTREDAERTIHHLKFEWGFFNRCREISGAHLNEAGFDFLREMSDRGKHPDLSVFLMAGGAIGVRLGGVSRPDGEAPHVRGSGAPRAWLGSLEEGMPISLVKVLYLAAEADIRFLIFDDGAPRLAGLPVYSDE